MFQLIHSEKCFSRNLQAETQHSTVHSQLNCKS